MNLAIFTKKFPALPPTKHLQNHFLFNILILFLFLAKFRQSKKRWAGGGRGWGSPVFCLGQFCVEAKVVVIHKKI
jgi:hypothetical protein